MENRNTFEQVEKSYCNLDFHSLKKPRGLIGVSFNQISTEKSVVILSIWHAERLSCRSRFSHEQPLFSLLHLVLQNAWFLQEDWFCFYFFSWIASYCLKQCLLEKLGTQG